MNKFLFSLALAALSVLPMRGEAAPTTGWWWNPAEGGRGYTIEVQGSTLFMAGYMYDVSGRATWVVSVGPMSSPTHYSGTLLMFGGGQTLTGAFKANAPQPSPGNITIDFSSDTTGTITWPGRTFPIQRFDIVAGGSSATQPVTNPEVGWWWNAAESGRGFAIEEQNGTVFLAGYMYDNLGNPIWYASLGAMANPTMYQGNWVQYGNGQTLTGNYKAATTVNANVGALTIQFTGPASATMTLPGGNQIPISRFAFGVSAPVLSAFSPAAATPENLLTVSGSGFDPFGTVSLQLFDATGYSVTVPAASVSVGAIKVAVPPYIVASSGAFGTSSVQVQAIQKSNGITLTSNRLSGFTIQPLPTVQGAAGTSTLALIRANLAEAQRLQAAVVGTAQATTAVINGLAQQVSNLQALVTNVQNVVQNGQSFALGVIGGVNITVTQGNIGDVDSLILATLQSLANPATGSGLKTGQASTPSCLSAEASALSSAMTSGVGNLTQLAQTLVQASGTSAACNTAAAFTSAYQIFGGAGNVGLGIANGAGAGTGTSRLPGAALFAAAQQNASTAVGLNALISPALAGQLSSVQSAIANVAALSNPTTSLLLTKTTGILATNLTGAQILTTGSSTSTGIQKAKAFVNALNSDAALVTGANAPPAVLSSFNDQIDPILNSIHDIDNGGASPKNVSFSAGTVNVSGVKSGSTTTYTAVVSPAAGGSYTSTWVVTSSTSGNIKTLSAQVSGSLMPVSTGAAATVISGSVAGTQNTVTGDVLTIAASNLVLSTANNGKGLPESLAISNLTLSTTTNPNGSIATRHATAIFTATLGTANYSVQIDMTTNGDGDHPVASGAATMTYTGPNGTFNVALQATQSGGINTDVFTITQGTTNATVTIGPYSTSGPRPSVPSSVAIYDGTTQIGTFSHGNISFVDGSFIAFSF